MLKVAIASENGHYDSLVYRELLSMLLPTEVEIWNEHRYTFNGWKPVVHNASLFLRDAARHGVHRALLAIDNDGGSKRRLEHHDGHIPSEETLSEQDGCAECLLAEQIPPDWKSPPFHACIVVSVQTLETWLLVLQGYTFKEKAPEGRYQRSVLKKDLFGKPIPPENVRAQMALELVKRPGALELLRQRPSFQRFEARLVGW
ncbi:hypothetical protein [Archangium sp.]|uniref:hypothetical protein n=1 Tax=Archangium sp. TaxID=1872627 RepID=UPI00286B2D10|nr:hypothetical protein [Archangium sp.]